MKLLKLNIHNIASITDAEIDFESQPLVSSEVFLITGKTGSGKSTILDAISLAIFGTTPRFKNTQMEGKSPEDEKISVNSPSQLIRRGAGEAWVKLKFLGNNGLHYEAEWSVARARRKESGKIQSKKWSLRIEEKNKTLNNDKEIFTEINNAIGLDFNQFCRTTMLAQGEFTKFLNSKDDEKSAILEKITGINVYSKIGAKVFEITNTKKNDYLQANERVNQVEILSDEQIKGIEEQKEQLNNESIKQVNMRNALNEKKKWLEDLNTKDNEATQAQKNLDEAKQTVQSNEFKQQETLVNDWSATAEARAWLKEKEAAAHARKKFEQDMMNHYTMFKSYMEGLLYLEYDISQQDTTLKENLNKVASQDDKKVIYTGWQAINERLNNLQACNERIDDENKALAKATARLNGDLKKAKEIAEKEFNNKIETLKSTQEEHTKLENELEACHIGDLRKRQAEINNNLHNIETAKLVLENRDKAQQQVDNKVEAIKNLEEIINKLKDDLNRLMQVKKEAVIIRDAKLSIHDKLRESVEQWAKNMRSKLKVGDKCPVCRQVIESEIPHEEEISSIFTQADNDLKEAEKALEKASDDINMCEANIKAKGEMKTKVEHELKTAKSDLAAQEKNLLEACNKCDIEELNEAISQRLGEIEKDFNKEKNEVKTYLDKAEEIEKKVKASQKELDKARQEHETAKDKLNKTDAAITKCKNDIDMSNRVINDNKSQINNLSESISKPLANTEWQHNWKTETKEFAIELEQSATAYNTLVDNCQNLQNQLKQIQNEYDNVKDTLNAIVAIMPEWSDVTPTVPLEIRNLLAESNKLRSQVAVTQQQITSSSEKEKELSKLIEEFVGHNPLFSVERISELMTFDQRVITDIERELQGIKNKVIACETAVKLKNSELETHRNNKPALDENDTAESHAAQIENINGIISDISQKVGALNQQINTDSLNKKRLGELIAERDRLNAVYEQWEQLNKLIGDKTGKKFRTIALSYILDNLIHSANYYMRTLTDRYTLKIQPGSSVINVVDAYQGCILRAASTISGGESFLVSLALALALSDIAQQLQVDMLFIDEGFGTLSGEPLQNAINTLRTLHNKTGRQVGIISHIEELKEKIPVQIRVNQEGNSSSSTVEVVSL